MTCHFNHPRRHTGQHLPKLCMLPNMETCERHTSSAASCAYRFLGACQQANTCSSGSRGSLPGVCLQCTSPGQHIVHFKSVVITSPGNIGSKHAYSGFVMSSIVRVFLAGGGSTPSPSSRAAESAGAGGISGTSSGLSPIGANAKPLGTPNFLFAGIAAAKPGH